LTQGGPYYRLVQRLHALWPSGVARNWWFALLLWLPIALGEIVRALRQQPADAVMHDVSVHVRILFSLPVILVAERMIDATCRGTVGAMYNGELCDRDALDRIVDRAEHMRDAWWPELLLLLVALTGGQLTQWGIVDGFAGDALGVQWSFPRVWYTMIALPMLQFVMWRWLWRWLIWSIVLARIARLQLAVLATHPDHAGGLEPLGWPLSAFSVFVVAISAILSAAWGTQVIAHRVQLPTLVPELIVFLLAVFAIALGPLLMFCGHLHRGRRRTLFEYTDLARDYTLRFHEKWIVRRTAEDSPLGSPDIQSLNDLNGSFQVIRETTMFPFGPRKIIALLVAALLPMVPLLASTMTLQQVTERIVKTVLGGLPI
jgi:hypothetical protein